jgi:hypothetical protein
MTQKTKILYFLFLCGFNSAFTSGQEAKLSTGGNASGSGGSASYSVGQVVYTTNQGTTGSVVQGVQQPYEISVVTGIEEANGINLLVSVYPNPATENVKLKVENYKIEKLSFHLYDANGNLLQNKKVESNETSINFSKLTPASYFLKVIEENKEIKTFKIIKN